MIPNRKPDIVIYSLSFWCKEKVVLLFNKETTFYVDEDGTLWILFPMGDDTKWYRLDRYVQDAYNNYVAERILLDSYHE